MKLNVNRTDCKSYITNVRCLNEVKTKAKVKTEAENENEK